MGDSDGGGHGDGDEHGTGNGADRARDYLLAEHRDLLATVLECADAVADGWDGDATDDRERVVDPLRAALDRAGALAACPAALAGAVRAAGYDLQAEPVAAPPYVTVASTGLLLRATVADGRLVAEVAAVAVERGPRGARYRRGVRSPEAALSVALR